MSMMTKIYLVYLRIPVRIDGEEKLMKRREELRARKAEEKPQKLLESDYLLGVYDEARMGGLRFKKQTQAGNSFLLIRNMQRRHGRLYGNLSRHPSLLKMMLRGLMRNG